MLPLRALRVDQVGSLAGPPALHALVEDNALGKVSDAELSRAQDDAIRQVILKQEAIGFPVLTDGEFRRRNFQESFGAAVSGYDLPADVKRSYIERQNEITKEAFQRAEQAFDAAGPAIAHRTPVRERLKLVRNVPLEEYKFSASVATRPVKETLVSVDRISQRFAHEKSKDVYADMDEFVADVVAIEREMVAQLVAAGCTYIQIDAPGYTAYGDAVSLERMRSRGEDPQENLERAIRADNAVIAGFGDVVFGIHLCRGNPRTSDPATGKVLAQWHREGHYDAYAERLFSSLDHDRILLEYDSDRAGGFEPLRFIPKGKIAVLGLVTTKSEAVESLELLQRRIAEASGHLPLDQLALSPQCGFGGVGTSVVLPEDVQWRKFERILETADRIWGGTGGHEA
ncbi:MAG TPA: cobalamin-independent methionine synthase II family protein [Candidatus Acidoferrales bacterium]|nr:cobalamin-independent methionine synthase II family protein [Candidatus Acidoferrales bacterium]